MSPAADPPPHEPSAWLARYSELQSSLFAALGPRLGLAGPGGRDAFGDLFQIAVTAGWLKERNGEPIRKPRAFLGQVIINQRKMQLRSERRHPITSWDALADAGDSLRDRTVEAIVDPRASVERQVEHRELAELLRHILLTIEPRASRVWSMRWLEHETPEDVAAALGITRRQYSRLYDRAQIAINRKFLAYVAGDWCHGYASKFSRLAAGLSPPAQAEEARAHLAACPRCRAAYETFTRLHPRP